MPQIEIREGEHAVYEVTDTSSHQTLQKIADKGIELLDQGATLASEMASDIHQTGIERLESLTINDSGYTSQSRYADNDEESKEHQKYSIDVVSGINLLERGKDGGIVHSSSAYNVSPGGYMKVVDPGVALAGMGRVAAPGESAFEAI